MRAITREAIETVALAVFFVLLIQATVSNYRVEGPSMDATLHDLDRVLVNKVLYMEIDAERVAGLIPGLDAADGEVWHPFGAPERGDIIVFRYPLNPRENFVKRVIGLPGDRVRLERGTVYVNDEPLEEPYISIEHATTQTLPERTVEPGTYYVLGDNRQQSDDSRHWGAVPAENIVGKVWVTYWPMGNIAALFASVSGSLGVVSPSTAG